MRARKSLSSVPVESRFSDAGVVARLKAGDAAAMEQALTLYWSPLVLYAARVLDDDLDAARDLAQDAFVRLWKHRLEVKPGCLKAYLYRVVRNLALDELRKRRVRRRWQAVAAEEDPPVSPPPSDVMEGGEVARAIARAISELPLRRREVFTLAYLHELSYRSIAQLMGISPATVKNQVAAALADLREALGPYFLVRTPRR